MNDSKNDKCISLEDMYKKMMSTLSSVNYDYSKLIQVNERYKFTIENYIYGLIKEVKNAVGLKVLGTGEINVALTVRAAKFSETAKEKIENSIAVAFEDIDSTNFNKITT